MGGRGFLNARRPGRNDPCPCGSGKKYKHCCLRKDWQRRRARAVSSASYEERGDAGRLDRIRDMARELMPHVPPDEAEELQGILDKVEAMAAYDAMLDEIEAAGQALEAHRAGFEKLMEDPEAAMERAQRLFSEERFAYLRYTTEDVHRAFEAVGYPSRFRKEPGEEEMKTLFAAALHLAGDMDQRSHLARQLMMALPEYVAAGRYLDGWLIQYSAYRMIEVPDESNPFLFVMFELAFSEWAHQMEDHQETLLRQLGIDASEVTGMDAEEVDALLKARLADPTKKGLLEAYYEAHPMLRDVAQAEFWGLERETVRLLERDDAGRLYLSPQEVDPWVPVLLERLEPMEAQAREAAARGDWGDVETLQEMGRIMAEVAEEMAPKLFTPERIERLVADLKDYRRDLVEKQEREAAKLAHAGYMTLEREDVIPDETPLLVGICFASLRAKMIALSREARARAEDKPEVEEG